MDCLDIVLIIDLVPQITDIYVHDIGIAEIIISPNFIHKFIPGNGNSFVFHQIFKSVEFFPGQCHRLSFDPHLP